MGISCLIGGGVAAPPRPRVSTPKAGSGTIHHLPTEAVVKHTPKVIYRDARDGQFVPKPWADKHPAITEREIVYTPSPKKG
jgi:hypothetical protein